MTVHHRYIFTFMAAAALTLLTAKAMDIQEIIGSDGEFFRRCDVDLFLAAGSPFQRYFRWTSAARDSARYPSGYIQAPTDLNFARIPVREAICHFQDRELSRVYLSLYNRGDDGDIPLPEFEALVKRLTDKLTALTRNRGVQKKGNYGRDADSHLLLFVTEHLTYSLRWNITSEGRKKDHRPEFVQLEIMPYNPATDPRSQAPTAVSKRSLQGKLSLRDNVVRQNNGTVFIDNIPMVDQGQKGYCSAAVTERVLKYFGNDSVTQHTIAQITNTSALTGTSQDEMLAAIRKADTKLGLKMSPKFELLESFADLEKIIRRYNTLARKNKLPKIELASRGGMINLGALLYSMDSETYLASRNQERQEREKFWRELKRNIDQGLPLGWGVFVGLVPEPGLLQSAGGHFRLLIGYNERNRTVFYSDTWGAGHEKKEMPLEQAWGITHSLFTYAPKR
ncbi:MAG: hypothetical protein GX902_10440 [Lentisphaerae bacterium]|jgi:hypothetical protein|nr:hypothetical protein [Lentisphaerota bacterium]